MTEHEEIRMANNEVEIAELKRRLKELSAMHSAMIVRLDHDRDKRNWPRVPDTDATPAKRVFDAQITGFEPTSGTPYKWKELYTTSAGIGAFTSGRSCTSLDGGAAVELNGWKFIPSGTNVQMTEYKNINNSRFVFIATVPAVPNPLLPYALLYSSALKHTIWVQTYLCSG